ncbi:hypothetical protein Tco_0944919 [Tanacetum coccineum]
MTRSSNKEIFEPYEEPEQALHSLRKLFKTTSFDHSCSPKFELFFDYEEQVEEETVETMTEPTMEDYMKKPKRITGQELRDNTFSGSENEDKNEHIERVLEIFDLFTTPDVTQDRLMLCVFLISLTGAASRWMEEINNFQQEPDETLYQAWERFKKLLLRCPQHYLTNMQESQEALDLGFKVLWSKNEGTDEVLEGTAQEYESTAGANLSTAKRSYEDELFITYLILYVEFTDGVRLLCSVSLIDEDFVKEPRGSFRSQGFKVLWSKNEGTDEVLEGTAQEYESTAGANLSTAEVYESTAHSLFKISGDYIEEVITKTIDYHLFDIVVEFHRCVFLSYLLAGGVTLLCSVSHIDEDFVKREMITSQLQGKLRLYDEVRARTLFVLSSSNRGRLLGIIDLMRQKNKRMKQEGLNDWEVTRRNLMMDLMIINSINGKLQDVT